MRAEIALLKSAELERTRAELARLKKKVKLEEKSSVLEIIDLTGD